jgi:RES domain-containing protein
MRLWRIAGASHAVWSGEGARLYGARWNPAGLPAIYAGTSYAICMLEILVHANRGVPPARLRYVQADLPEPVAIERAEMDGIAGWNSANLAAAQAYGGAWLRSRRSLVLLVPSVVTEGLDWNAVINPLHPAFADIVAGPEHDVAWDPRLRENAGGSGGLGGSIGVYADPPKGTAPPALPS